MTALLTHGMCLFGPVIWDALKAACDADLATAKVILESAGVVVASDNMTVCYDERGEHCCAHLTKRYEVWPCVEHAHVCLHEVGGNWAALVQEACVESNRAALHAAGRKYELPKYVISTPTNLKQDGKAPAASLRQVELTAGGGSQ